LTVYSEQAVISGALSGVLHFAGIGFDDMTAGRSMSDKYNRAAEEAFFRENGQRGVRARFAVASRRVQNSLAIHYPYKLAK